jgi:hypothetical protein
MARVYGITPSERQRMTLSQFNALTRDYREHLRQQEGSS